MRSATTQLFGLFFILGSSVPLSTTAVELVQPQEPLTDIEEECLRLHSQRWLEQIQLPLCGVLDSSCEEDANPGLPPEPTEEEIEACVTRLKNERQNNNDNDPDNDNGNNGNGNGNNGGSNGGGGGNPGNGNNGGSNGGGGGNPGNGGTAGGGGGSSSGGGGSNTTNPQNPNDNSHEDERGTKANDSPCVDSTSSGDNFILDHLTGEITAHVNLFNVAGADSDFSLSASYSNLLQRQFGYMPWGWTFSHEFYLRRLNGGDLQFITGEGRRILFPQGSQSPSSWPLISISQETDSIIINSADEKFYHFDSTPSQFLVGTHLVQKIVDARGRETQFVYDNKDRLSQVISPYGRIAQYYWTEFEGRSYIDRIVAPNGQEIHFNLNTRPVHPESVTAFSDRYLLESLEIDLDDQTKATYEYRYQLFLLPDASVGQRAVFERKPEGSPYTVNYAFPGNLNGPVGNFIQISHDGQIIDQAFSTENFKLYQEDFLRAGEVVYTDGNSNQLIYQRDALGRPLEKNWPNSSLSKKWEYGSEGIEAFLVKKIMDEANFETTYEYDDVGRKIAVTNPLGHREEWSYSQSEFRSRVTSNRSADGNETTTEFQANGDTGSITDAMSNQHRFTYENHTNPSLIRSIIEITPNNRLTKKEYDLAGNLIRLTRAYQSLNLITEYQHNQMGQVTRSEVFRENQPNIISEFGYDLAGRLIEQRSFPQAEQTPSSELIITRYEYDRIGNKIKETLPEGNQVEFEYDGRNRLIRQTQISEDSENLTSLTEYDSNSNIIRVISPTGKTIENEYNDRDQLIRTSNNLYDQLFEYDARGNLIRHDRMIQSTPESYHSVAFEYDELSRKTKKILDPDNLALTTSYFHEAPEFCGCSPANTGSTKPWKVVSPEGRITLFEYDDLNRVIKKVQKNDNDIDLALPQDSITAYIYDGIDLIRSVKPMGETTELVYDEAGRVIQSIYDPDGFHLISEKFYDEADHIISSSGITGFEMYSQFDGVGRLVEASDEFGLLTTNRYDLNSNLIESIKGRTDLSLNQQKRYISQYNGLNLMVQQTDPLGFFEQTFYRNGLTSEAVDKKGRRQLIEYDQIDRMIQSTDNYNSQSDEETDFTNSRDIDEFKTYDGLNRLVEERSHDGHSVAYTHDSAGRVIQMHWRHFFDSSSDVRLHLEYDDDNLLIKRINPNGSSIHLIRDGQGRIIRKVGAQPGYAFSEIASIPQAAKSFDIYFDYDLSGRAVSARNENIVIEMEYDSLGRLIDYSQQWVDGSNLQQNLTVNYLINDRSSTRLRSSSSGRVLVENFDGRGRLQALQLDDEIKILFDYDQDNLMTNTNRILSESQSLQSRYEYDLREQLVGLEHFSSTQNLWHTENQYDAAGNRIDRVNHLKPQLSEKFGLDGLDRVISHQVGEFRENGFRVNADHILPHNNVWLLDEQGNWLVRRSLFENSFNIEQRTHNRSNQITHIQSSELGNVSLQYDSNDNLQQNPIRGQRYEYDTLNRLVQVFGDGNELLKQYAYDAFSRRAASWTKSSRCINGQYLAIRFMYNGTSSDVMEEYESCENLDSFSNQPAPKLAREYVNSNGYQAMIDWTELGQLGSSQAEVLYPLQESDGSIVSLVNAQAEIVERYFYDPYGKTKITDSENQIRSASHFGNPFAFTSQRFEPALGLYEFQFRHYDPNLGRWLQRDFIGTMDGMNNYAYVGNRPNALIDPTGLCGESIDANSSNWSGAGYRVDLQNGKLAIVDPNGDRPLSFLQDLVHDPLRIRALGEAAFSEGQRLADVGEMILSAGAERGDSNLQIGYDIATSVVGEFAIGSLGNAVYGMDVHAEKTFTGVDRAIEGVFGAVEVASLALPLAGRVGAAKSAAKNGLKGGVNRAKGLFTGGTRKSAIKPESAVIGKNSAGQALTRETKVYRAHELKFTNEAGGLEANSGFHTRGQRGTWWTTDPNVGKSFLRTDNSRGLFSAKLGDLVDQGARFNPNFRGQPREADLFLEHFTSVNARFTFYNSP